MGNHSRFHVAAFCCCLTFASLVLGDCPRVGVTWSELGDPITGADMNGAGGGILKYGEVGGSPVWQFKSGSQYLWVAATGPGDVTVRIGHLVASPGAIEEWTVTEEIVTPTPTTPTDAGITITFTPTETNSNGQSVLGEIVVKLTYPFPTVTDACRKNVKPDRDTDGDGIPDYLDPDDDNDGIPDTSDPDDDGDGVPDTTDIHSADNPQGMGGDANGNGVIDGDEYDPEDPEDDPGDPPATGPSEDCLCCEELKALLTSRGFGVAEEMYNLLGSDGENDNIWAVLDDIRDSIGSGQTMEQIAEPQVPTSQPAPTSMPAVTPVLAAVGNLGIGSFGGSGPTIATAAPVFTLPLSIGMMGGSPIVGSMVIDATWYVGSTAQTIVNISLVFLSTLSSAWLIFNEFKRR